MLPWLYRFEICSNFHIHENKNKNAFSLEFVSLHKKIIPCYSIGYRCLNLRFNCHHCNWKDLCDCSEKHRGSSTWPFIICASPLWSETWNDNLHNSQLQTGWDNFRSDRTPSLYVKLEVPKYVILYHCVETWARLRIKIPLVCIHLGGPLHKTAVWQSRHTSLRKSKPVADTKLSRTSPKKWSWTKKFIERIEALVLQSLSRKMFCDQGNPSN